MRLIIRAAGAAAVLAGLTWFARAAADGERSENFRVNVDMVQLRATVTDASGDYVRNLTRNDFHVYENGVEQKIREVRTPAQPESAANVLILIDTSNHMYSSFAYLEDAVADFIRNLAPADSIALYNFSRNLMRLSPLTHDRNLALARLRDAVLGDDTALYNAMLLALRDAERMDGTKVLVVFSNGPDRASILTPDDIRSVAEDAGVPIYVVSATQHNRAANAAFDELTFSTGGRIYFALDWQKQREAFDSIDRDLNNSYVINYYPAPDAPPGYREIEVRISSAHAEQLHIRTRSGYHVDAPEQP